MAVRQSTDRYWVHPLVHRLGKVKKIIRKTEIIQFKSRTIYLVSCVTLVMNICLAQGVSSIHAGATYSLAVSGGQLYFWGLTKSTGDATMYPKPVRDMSGWDVRSVGCS